jgi:proton-dependent oligopeptide transporter, POT family
LNTNETATAQQGQPKGVYLLSTVEMWERFSFYGMRGLLLLYMTKQLGFPEKESYGIYGAYGALVYLAPVAGGFLADRFLGYRLAIILGGLIMAAGQFTLMAESTTTFYIGLTMLAIGNGFFKPNISSIVGQFYGPNDSRRDRGFVLFYMGINIGAALATAAGLFAAYMGNRIWGFGLSGAGMLLGQVIFFLGSRTYEGLGLPPDREKLFKSSSIGLSPFILILLGTLVTGFIFYYLFHNNGILTYLLPAIFISLLVYMVATGIKDGPEARDKLIVAVIMFVFSILFWALFEQAGSSFTVFTDRNVIKTMWGITLTAEVINQFFNPFFIVVLAPFFNIIWSALAARKMEPSIPAKFGLGILFLGTGFLVLAASSTAAVDGMVPLYFMVLCYLLHTTGELCLSPVGLSMVTKLTPTRITSMVMGVWFLTSSVGHKIGGEIAKLTAGDIENVTDPVKTLATATDIFQTIGYVAAGTGIMLIVVSPYIRKLMHGVR